MIYGYARVSTAGQMRDGNSIEDQIMKLKAAGAEKIFTDAFTGTKKERPELKKLLMEISEGDTLVVCKLDRVARSITVGVQLIEELTKRNITVNILNLGILDNTPSGKLMRNVFFAFAEFERDMIVERTTEGKNIAKMKDPNWRCGRKKKECKNEDEFIEKFMQKEMTLEEVIAATGLGQATIYRRVKEKKLSK